MSRTSIAWVLFAGPAVMVCWIASLAAAALLLPPNVLMQVAFTVPVFLITGSVCSAAMLRRAGAKVRVWGLTLTLAVVSGLQFAGIFSGVTTLGEAAVVGLVLYSLALWMVWRTSPRQEVSR